mmetsp:Transcript_5391/g.16083  ORF Transcript_5391/g.16083 Transcript_5391/m.16083 type:complete len:704 (+) Transcript_5391:333-2444(+)
MEEILALQRRLAAVQLEGSATRLSERNCVELVSKLATLHLIDVVFTQTGKEYLTRERLRKEIEDEIALHGGRVNIVDIANLIGVDLHHVETELSQFLEQNKSTARMIQGEIITDEYYDATAEEISETLSRSGDGIVTLADLATGYNLPIDTIRSTVEARVGTLICGKLEGGSLYTEAHLNRTKARVRGLLSGAATPIAIGDIASTLGVRSNLIDDAVQSLVSENRLIGEVRGRGERATFTPATFEKAREDAIESFFVSNEYIDMNRLRQFSIAKPQQFAKQKFPTATTLENIVIADTLLVNLKDAVSGAAHAAGWLDVQPLLPPSIEPEDGTKLLTICCAEIDGVTMAEDRFAVSLELLMQCKQLFEQDAESKALSMIQATPKASQIAVQPTDDRQKQKGKRRKAKDNVEMAPTAGISMPEIEQISDIIMNSQSLGKTFEADHLGEEADAAEVVEAIAVLLREDIERIYAEAEVKAREKLEKEKADIAKKYEREIAALLPRISVYNKGIESVSIEELSKLLRDHLLDNSCKRLCNTCLTYFSGRPEIPEIESLPSRAQKHARALASAETPQEFLEAYDIHGRELSLPPRILLDKKKEKLLSQSIRAELSEQLSAETDAVKVLLLASVLMFCRCKGGAVIEAPYKAIPFLMEELKQSVKGDMAEPVFELHRQVLENVQRKSEGEATMVEGMEDLISKVKEKILM